ncbi:type IV pilus assembly protein PilW [Trinickia symbiotica]|uniref:Type IV pillus assembly protein n=1 Tax=Trinickia symbiotica TaxID=863227 RepID=A0A2N7X0Y3_9BURK|nr:PilW family protein [Trinickia symbiotica]PMS35408.1 type IV pillus assembly protein [Trinickia symbiotica]PPK45431.1 type IV pilus assembly protein PilW [Trinickia symbiotica]
MRRLRTCSASPTRRCGHALLELLIATALGTLLVGVAALLYRTQREASMLAEDMASMRDAGMTALVLLGQQIEMAGFAPLASSDGGTDDHGHSRGPLLGVFGCDSGVPSADAGPIGCDRLRGVSDSIVVRYIDDGVSTWKTATSRATDCLGHGIGAARAQAFVVNTFYASRDDRGEPQLYCRGNGGGRPSAVVTLRAHTGKQPVVAGIERLSMRYWLRGASASVRAWSIAAHQWPDVVAVDLCVVVRGARTVARRDYIDCEGLSVPTRDRRARAVFSRRVAVRNNER